MDFDTNYCISGLVRKYQPLSIGADIGTKFTCQSVFRFRKHLIS